MDLHDRSKLHYNVFYVTASYIGYVSTHMWNERMLTGYT
jgi:hypothetical protein